MSPCDSNKKNSCWKGSPEVLLCLYSNSNPPMQNKIHLCEKISCGNQRPFWFYCCCPKWRYISEHCQAQNYGPWLEVTYAMPEDLIHYRDRFNTFMLYLNVWLMMVPKDCTGTQGLLGRKSLLYFCQIPPRTEILKKNALLALCCSSLLPGIFHFLLFLLLWTGTKSYPYNLD